MWNPLLQMLSRISFGRNLLHLRPKRMIILYEVHRHIHFPSESKLRSARDMGNYYNQTSTFQAPLYKSLLMRPPCFTFGRLKPWWVENFLCKRFNLIIPAFPWATNSSARFYTVVHLPALVGIPFTRNRRPGIHCRCNLRCETKSSNQQSLSPRSNIEYLLCIFQFFDHFVHQCMPIIVHQGCPSNNWTKHTVSHRFKFLKLIRSQGTGHKAKYNCGSDDGIKKFQTQSQRHMPVQKCVLVLVKFHPSDLTPMFYIHHGPFSKVSR